MDTYTLELCKFLDAAPALSHNSTCQRYVTAPPARSEQNFMIDDSMHQQIAEPHGWNIYTSVQKPT